MNLKQIVRAAAVVSTTAIAGVAESAGHDQFPNTVQNFMQDINDPNVKAHGRSNLLYDGNDLVVVNGNCGPTAVRVFLNQKNNELVALFAAYTGVPEDAHNVKHVGNNSPYAHALIVDATQSFAYNGAAIDSDWYNANGGPLPGQTDEAQLKLTTTQSCGGASGGGSNTPPAPGTPPTTPGTPTPTPPSHGCGCNGHNPDPITSTPNENHNGGNTPPGFEDSDASKLVQEALRRLNGPMPSLA